MGGFGEGMQAGKITVFIYIPNSLNTSSRIYNLTHTLSLSLSLSLSLNMSPNNFLYVSKNNIFSVLGKATDLTAQLAPLCFMDDSSEDHKLPLEKCNFQSLLFYSKYVMSIKVDNFKMFTIH